MIEQPVLLALDKLYPHPKNPRLIERTDVIEQIANLLHERGEFDPAHAIMVRPKADGWEIISGHNRVKAAKWAALDAVPAWVRKMDDDAAYMALVLSNTQGELSPLEKGLHALESGKSLRVYATETQVGKATVEVQRFAAEVYRRLDDTTAMLPDLHGKATHLAEIHHAPADRWQELVEMMLRDDLSSRAVRELVQEIKQRAKRRAAFQAQEEAADRFKSVSLTEWHKLNAATKAILVDLDKVPKTGIFNRQDSDSIEWAQWSWNPITGCEHDCPYCYARDIATLGQTAHAFPNGFAPTLRPYLLRAPANMTFPAEAAAEDARYGNVFCGSMSDWFGRWVPKEWIDAVLGSMRLAPRWKFLVLTKFPKRMAEFELPRNMWPGTTVDLQARVKNAEAAFADIDASVRWLSIEPMLENLRFSRLDLFHWIVIGGASRSSETPEWKPPFRWVMDLVAQATEAGCKVYMKDNLLGNRLLELPGNLPVKLDYEQTAPAVFHYLGAKKPQPAPAIKGNGQLALGEVA